MKKLLLLAAVALLGGTGGAHATGEVKHIVWNETITPVSQLTDGGIYLIYDASKITKNPAADTDRRAFRKVEPGSDAITGLEVSKDAGDLAYSKFAWQAIKSGDAWQFRHLGSDKYIQGAVAVVNHMKVTDEPGSYTLEDYNATHGAFRVKSTTPNVTTNDNGTTTTTYQYWDGLQADREMCTWSSGSDLDGSHWYQFFEVTDDMIITINEATFKLTYPDGTVCYSQTFYDVTPGEEFIADLPFYIKKHLTVTPEQFESGEDIPLEFVEGFTPFKLMSARYRRWATTNTNGLTTVNGSFSNGEWYLEETVGENLFKIYSAANDTYFGAITNSGNPTPKTTAEEAQIYHLVQLVNGTERVFNYTGTTNVAWNIRDNHVAGWNGLDQGSSWFMVYDADAFAANSALFYAASGAGEAAHTHLLSQMTDLWGSDKTGGKLAEAHELWNRIGGLSNKSHEDMETIKANLESAINRGNNFRFGRYDLQQLVDDLTAAIAAAETVSASIDANQVTWSQLKMKGDLLTAFVPAEETEAWQSVIADTELPVTTQDIANLTTAYNRLSARVGGVSINMRPFNAENELLYISADDATQPKRSTNVTSRAWTLISNEAGTGFYIYNEYSDRYMKHASLGTNNNPAMGFVSEKSEASVYNLLVYNTELPTFIFKTIDPGINASFSCLHSNATDYLQCWTDDVDNSSFYVSLISNHQAATEHFNGINDVAAETAAEVAATIAAKPAGTELCQYTYTSNIAPNLAETYNSATVLASDTESDTNDFRLATEAYRAAYDAYTAAGDDVDLTCTLNMPAPGDLIRLKWVSADGTTVHYASNVNNSNKKLDMVSEGDGANTVWYVDDANHLVSFSTGLCLGSFKVTDGWQTVLSTDSKIAPALSIAEFTPNTCHYTIATDRTRYIYGGASEINAGTLNDNQLNADLDLGYAWMLERVHMLPIPVGDAGFTTVHAPVDLNFSHSDDIHAVAHIGKIAATNFEYKALANNNGTYLPANTPALLQVKNRNNGHVYAEVVYPAATPAEQAAAPYAADEETEATPDVNHLKSDFLAKAKQEGMNYYVLNDAGTSFEPHTGDYIPGFAAHLAVSDEENPQMAYTLKDTSSIEEINADSAAANKADTIYYDLCGRRVATPRKGIYVTNHGTKVIF